MKKLNKNNKAQAMIVVFVYIGVVSICAVALMYYAAYFNHTVSYQLNHTNAYYAGEAGLVRAATELYNGASSLNYTIDNIFDAEDIGQDIDVKVETFDITAAKRVVVTVSNWR